MKTKPQGGAPVYFPLRALKLHCAERLLLISFVQWWQNIKSNRLLKSACGCFWPWSAQLRKHLFCFICLEFKDTQPEALYSSFRIFTLMYWRCFAKYNLRMLGNTSRYQIRYQIAWWVNHGKLVSRLTQWVMQNINLLFVKSAPENKH